MRSPPAFGALWTLCSLILCVGILGGCAARSSVERKYGEVIERGRPISGAAYAWYVRGLVAARQDRQHEARYSFLRALRADVQNGAGYAALIQLDCATRPDEVEKHLNAGLRHALRPGVVRGAAAQCALLRGEVVRARELAEAALATEPFLAGANRTYCDALERLGEKERSERWRRAYRLATGSPLDEWPLATSSTAAGAIDGEENLEKIDAALRRGDLEEARHLSGVSVSPGELSARALGWGKRDLAKQQALLVNDADPFDPDARVVLFLLQEDDEVDRDLFPRVEVYDQERSPSLVAKLLLARELQRVVGVEVSRQLLTFEAKAIAQSVDALVNSLAEHFRLPHTAAF